MPSISNSGKQDPARRARRPRGVRVVCGRGDAGGGRGAVRWAGQGARRGRALVRGGAAGGERFSAAGGGRQEPENYSAIYSIYSERRKVVRSATFFCRRNFKVSPRLCGLLRSTFSPASTYGHVRNVTIHNS